MSGESDTSSRLCNFLIFLGLTIITLGSYPMFFWVSRIEEQNALIGQILALAGRSGEGRLE